MRKNSSIPTPRFELLPWDRGHVIAAVIAVAMLAAVVIWTFPRRSLSNDNTNQRSSSQDTTTTGDTFDRPAPAFSLPATDGMTVTSDILFQKFLVVLTFWSVECQTCQAQLEELRALMADPNVNAMVVAINRGDDSDRVKSVKDAANVDFPMLFDRDGRVVAAYGADALPATFFIRQGIVVGIGRGLLNVDQLKSSVTTLLTDQ